MSDRVDVVVVGGGQAGLAVSRELTQAGVAHVVLERGKVGQTWRGRWDSFCLVTPNWTVQLPGHPYDGDDPDGFMPRDESWPTWSATRPASRRRCRKVCEVTSLQPGPDGALPAGDVGRRDRGQDRGPQHRRLPAAPPPAGSGHAPRRPASDRRRGLPQPGGPASRRGAGGRQRPVRLPDRRGAPPGRPRRLPGLRPGSVGAPQARRPRHRLVAARDRLPRRAASARCQPRPLGWPPTRRRRGTAAATTSTTGRCGTLGVTLLGHFLGADGRRARFAPDLDESVAWGDERNAQIMDLVRKLVAERGLPSPEIPEPEPFDAGRTRGAEPERLRRRRLRGRLPARLRVMGPTSRARSTSSVSRCHEEGASTAVRGLYFVGVHFLRKRKSSLLIGVGEDAAIVARQIAAGE